MIVVFIDGDGVRWRFGQRHDSAMSLLIQLSMVLILTTLLITRRKTRQVM